MAVVVLHFIAFIEISDASCHKFVSEISNLMSVWCFFVSGPWSLRCNHSNRGLCCGYRQYVVLVLANFRAWFKFLCSIFSQDFSFDVTLRCGIVISDPRCLNMFKRKKSGFM